MASKPLYTVVAVVGIAAASGAAWWYQKQPVRPAGDTPVAGASAPNTPAAPAAERNIPAWAVMISIVATEPSAATFLSVPGIAYHEDWTYLQFAIGYILARIVVALVLLPSYFRGQIQTAYSNEDLNAP